MTQLNPEIIKQIQQKAEDKYPFQWPKNKKGEAIEQRVGQNPVGWRKHQNIVKAYIAGAEEYALKWQQADRKNIELSATLWRHAEMLTEACEMMEKMAHEIQNAWDNRSDGCITNGYTIRLRNILIEYNNYKNSKDDNTGKI